MKIAFRQNRMDLKRAMDAMLSMIRDYPELFDEMAIFTDMTEHCYESVADMTKWSRSFGEMMDKFKKAGVKSAGLNILNTIGQNDDSWDWLEPSPFQTMVGHDGGTTTGTICMRAPGFREYMCEKYRIYARSNPDFIWVDDDMRIIYHGVHHPCFCHTCVEKFNRLQGTHYRREQLAAALGSGKDKKLCRAWMEYNANEMCDLLKACAEAAREIKEDIEFGLMTTDVGWNFYNFSNFKEMLQAVKGTWLRPGGGFWTAEKPDTFFEKMVSCAYQIYESGYVTDIQYESENIPHVDSKPQAIHAIELTAALMAGCNGLAIDSVRPTESESFRRLLKTLRKYRPLWDKIVDQMKDYTLRGGCCAYKRDAAARVDCEDWFAEEAYRYFTQEKDFFKAGFAFATEPKKADFVCLSGGMVDVYSDEELKEMFRGAVVMDGEAGRKMALRGLGHLCGCGVGNAYTNGIRETYLPSSMNPSGAAGGRGGSQAQFRGGKPIYVADMLPGGVPLTAVFSTTDVFCGYGSFVYENDLGGRVAVLSYVAWSLYEQKERIELLRGVVRYICREKPVLDLGQARHVLPILRMSEDEQGFVLMLTNAWLDEAENLTVRVRGEGEGSIWKFSSKTGKSEKIPVRTEGGMRVIELAKMEPWEFVILSSEEL